MKIEKEVEVKEVESPVMNIDEAEVHNAEEIVNSELTDGAEIAQAAAPKIVIETFDLSDANTPLPNLSEANVVPFDLVSEYWTPEVEGESKNCFFIKLEKTPVLDSETKELNDLLCAFFLEQKADGQTKQVYNGSKILIGTIISHGIQYGTPLQIIFTGKKKNKTNQNKSDQWSVKPIIVNRQLAQ